MCEQGPDRRGTGHRGRRGTCNGTHQPEKPSTCHSRSRLGPSAAERPAEWPPVLGTAAPGGHCRSRPQVQRHALRSYSCRCFHSAVHHPSHCCRTVFAATSLPHPAPEHHQRRQRFARGGGKVGTSQAAKQQFLGRSAPIVGADWPHTHHGFPKPTDLRSTHTSAQHSSSVQLRCLFEANRALQDAMTIAFIFIATEFLNH